VVATPPARPLYLGTQPDAVFGFFHAVDPGAERDTAVLICPPFGWDDVCSYRGRMRWAEHLAAAGHPTLRIDLPGTGDSAGSPRDPDRLGAWRDAIAGAAAWLRAETPCARVAVIGMGMGGFAACVAAAEGAAIDDLILWGVPARGRTMLRELRAFAALKAGEFPDPDAEEPPPLPEGYLEVAGYVITAETAAALEGADLSELPFPDAARRRALLLDRDGVSVDRRLREHLEAVGADVTVASGPGYGQMVTNPQEASPPIEVFATVSSWLLDAPAGAAIAPSAVPEARDSLELTANGSTVHETPMTVELATGRLFGILASPTGAPAADVALVLANAGAVRRIGPNRMWVETARRWAARGLPVLRLDIEGLGDSDGDETVYAHTPTMYATGLADQMRAAVDDLESREVASRFAVGGLCAGAFWSFHVLLGDPRVSSALMLNLFSFFWDDDLPDAVEVRRIRKLARASSWRRIMRGELRWSQIRAILRWIRRAPFELPSRLARRREEPDRLDAAFDRLREDDKRAVLLLGRGEPLMDQFRREGRLERLGNWPNLGLHQLPTRDHTFRALWLQQQVHELIDTALEEEMRRAGSPPAPVQWPSATLQT
jgi:pimeloyl-ACP methyl ester carboxylesterase